MICSICFYSFLTCAVISFEGGVKRYNVLFKEYVTRLDRAGSRSLGWDFFFAPIWQSWMWHVRRQESAILWSMCLTWTYCWWKKSCSWYGKYLRIYVLDIPGGAGFLKHQQYVWHQHWASFSCQHGASFSWKTSIVFHHTPGRAALFFALHIQTPPDKMPIWTPKNLPKKNTKPQQLFGYLDV